MPQPDSKFLVDELSETIEIFIDKKRVYLKYTTPYNRWKEELKSISSKNMEVISEDNKIYIYKRIKHD